MSVVAKLARMKAPPIVVVLGATGTGKSKLAIELAQRFNGEIISADAVQMYKGLDIVTNKVSREEMELVQHHCIDFLDPSSAHTVVQFRNMALPIIDGLLRRGKTPVICGGTNYYVESLLWKVLVDEVFSDDGDDGEEGDLEGKTNEELHEMLTVVDAARADELHANDRRKVLRSLQVFRRHGRPHSEILREQKEEGGGLLGGPLRFPAHSVLVIWVQCDQKVLDERCDGRVGKMIEAGMVDELRRFHEGRGGDGYTRGIFQTIGFKEFHEYLTAAAPPDESLLTEGIERMKAATRQYARRQLKWMNQRFLNPGRQRPKVYAVDSSRYPDGWAEDVFEPAADVVRAYIEGGEASVKPLAPNGRTYSHEESRKMFRCEECGTRLKGRLQLEAHLGSDKHRAVAARRKREEEAAAKSDVEQSLLRVVAANACGDGAREDRKRSMLRVKAATGLPFDVISKSLYRGDGGELRASLKGGAAEDINSGMFDNDHYSVRVVVEPVFRPQ